jgi:DNA-binding transcriptional MerR regulator
LPWVTDDVPPTISSRPRLSAPKSRPAVAGTVAVLDFEYVKFLTVVVVSSRPTSAVYTIKDVAALTGLPASTLRYYESIGVIEPVGRGESSGHRLYTEADLDQVTWLACLAATGMSVSDMREYVANGRLGPGAAREQIDLLQAQEERLAQEAEQIALRRRYVRLKIEYWRAVDAGDDERADLLAEEAGSLASALKRSKR